MERCFLKWFRLTTRCWTRYIKSSEKDFRNKLKYPITLFFSIILYKLTFSESSRVVYIIICVLVLFIMPSPKYFILGVILFLIYMISFFLIDIKPIKKYIKGEYSVINHIRMGSVVKIGNQNVLIHSKIKSNIGDNINIEGWVKPVKNYHGFDSITYLKTQKISSEIFPKQISINSYNKSFFNKTRHFIEEGNSTWRKIGPMLLLGDRVEESKKIFEISKRLSILHLFVISGFHIGIIYKVISFILNKLKITYFDLFSLFPIILYVFLLNWTIPSTRALLFIMFTILSKKIPILKINNMDSLGLVGMLLVCLNPFIIDSLSFRITFIATITIIYLNFIDIKSKTKKYFLINICVFIATLPIMGSLNGWISLWGIFYSITLTPLISVIYVISICLLPFKSILNIIYLMLILVLKIFNETVIIIKINSFSRILTYNYYIIFIICILFMEKKASLSAMKKKELLKNSG